MEILESSLPPRHLQVCFVSGHLDLTEDEFRTHYVPKLEQYLQEGCKFVVGDARGCDAMTQEFLASHPLCYLHSATVYHMFENPRNNIGDFNTRGGYVSDDERDATMTASSHFDLAWVRPGREKSGTAKNLKRRDVMGHRKGHPLGSTGGS